MPMCLSDDHIVWLLNTFPGHRDDDIACKSCSKLFDESVLDNTTLLSCSHRQEAVALGLLLKFCHVPFLWLGPL